MSHSAADTEQAQPPPGDDHAFFGQPRGLMTLSGPEVRERFSFLGTQAVLVLFFADTVSDGGMGMDPGTAASVSAATYGTLVCLVSVAGGRPADRILGSYRAVLCGGIPAAIGMPLGLIQYVAGRRHPVGRTEGAECAPAPDAMRRAVRLIIGGAVAVALVATVPARAGWLTIDRCVDVLTVISVIAPVACFVVMSKSPRVTTGLLAAPWPKRTMHPAH